MYCAPKSIIKAIIQINRWVFRGVPHLPANLRVLELRILNSNPSTLANTTANSNEQLSYHHSYAWYFATYIYFDCTLMRSPPQDVQYLVRQGIEHLEAIQVLELGQIASGLLWPVFITGCEAEEVDLRARIIENSDRRDAYGIGGTATARRVVLEVWNRRDRMRGSINVPWHEIMPDLEVDILLS